MNRAKRLSLSLIGIGPIGASIVKLAHNRKHQWIGAVDIDPQKIGKDLGQVAGLNSKLGVRVESSLEQVLQQKPDLVIHSTVSSLEKVYPQILECVHAGIDVISTTEELAYPYQRHNELAKRLDQQARKNNVTILGTGVNPGFLMDLLPLTLTGPCWEVRHLLVERRIDADLRRGPFQRKIGAGLSIEEFNRTISAGGGHVGLLESLYMVADGLSITIDHVEESIEPVVATAPFTGRLISVDTGKVLGLRQSAQGYSNEHEIISLSFAAFLGLENPADRIVLNGEPMIEMVIPGGIHGDAATAAMVVNSIHNVLAASAGLVTMKDLPVPRAMGRICNH
ncbi:dihydrodipicolinate reductase [Candidatus Acetothermia bacterium]|jgi:4-hydroxy-tetrahydrodipicolinate reductase|nr:dihydrodipicolinate reductase [Candidatus Acetothermia bacterium]MCI2427289.1 dihydrodipicolinate reductase [Candidatus Acetothermia bacterium]MCI2428183.1 dihydrodipicolinate reductase [Candidatus Acetothermia bacterium]